MADIHEIRGALTAAQDTIGNAEQHLMAATAALDDVLRYLAHVGSEHLAGTAGIVEHDRQDIWAVIAHLRDSGSAIGNYLTGL
jgi:hypothetical protein